MSEQLDIIWYRTEVTQLRARNERQRATLAKIRAIVADAEDRHDWIAVHEIRAALEPTPKGKP